jgi:endonuclease/exonuclease/phosphatase family metal-dependent hydrolase
LEIFNYSRRHINAVVKDMGGQPIWKMTGFYGHPDSSKRDESWATLRHLKLCGPIPWLCAGDFNEIVDQSEKEGYAVRREAQMVRFREALEECQLGDLGFVGPFFTWSNRRMDDTYTRERLDRAVANPEWCSIFPIVSVLILAARTSDHNPMVVKFQECTPERCSVRRGFKFEACWMKDRESFEVIKEAWCNRAEGGSVYEGYPEQFGGLSRGFV